MSAGEESWSGASRGVARESRHRSGKLLPADEGVQVVGPSSDGSHLVDSWDSPPCNMSIKETEPKPAGRKS